MPDPWDTPTKKVHPLIDCNVVELTKNATGINDLDTLTAMRESELANQNRISALEAIDERIRKVRAVTEREQRPKEARESAEPKESEPATAVFVTRAGEKFDVEYPSMQAMLTTTKVCIAHAKHGRGVLIPYRNGHVMIVDLDHVQLHGTAHLNRDDLIIR